MEQDYIILKYGTLKGWNITSDEGIELLKKWYEIGSSPSIALQNDTQEQKEIICKLIDIVPGDIYLDWDREYVSKEKAKQYVMEYRNDE